MLSHIHPISSFCLSPSAFFFLIHPVPPTPGDYAASDKVREDLAAKGIGLMDGGAQAWRPVVPAAMLQAE